MKNTVLKFVSVLFFVFVIFGCTNIEQNSAKKTTSISVSLDSSNARTIYPEYYSGIASIVLTGIHSGDKEAREIKTWTNTTKDGLTTYAYENLSKNPVINDLEVGKWEFALSCYNEEKIKVYSANAEATLSVDVASVVHFKLESVSGSGELEFSFFTYEDAIGKVLYDNPKYVLKAQLKTPDGKIYKDPETLTVEKEFYYTAKYNVTDIPSGYYIVLLEIFEKDGGSETKVTTVSEIVNIASGLKTTGSREISSLNQSYEIKYAKYVYEYYDDGRQTTKGNFELSWLTGNVPLSFMDYDTITLPTALDVLQPCKVENTGNYTDYTLYAFDGWYLDEDLTRPIEKIIGSEQTGDISLYASFKELELRYTTTTAIGLDKPGKLEIEFDTTAALSKEWLEKIEWSLDRDDIIQIDNLKPNAFHEEYTDTDYNGDPYTHYVNYVSFESAKALKFGKATLSAKINGVLIGACEIEFSPVFTQEVANAFYPDKTITTMEVPAIYTSAADYAFSDSWPLDDYPNLETVILPDTFTSIGDFAFANCGKLKTVNIPNGVTYIGEYAFGSGYDDTNDVFYDCKFETITIPATVKTIGDNAFMRCKQLKTVIVEATEPPKLGDGVFAHCDSLEAIYVPSGSLEDYKTSWSSYKDKIQVHQVEFTKDIFRVYCEDNYDSLTTSGKMASNSTEGKRYKSIISFDIPNGYTSIGDSAFENCTVLTGLTIPEGIETLAGYAFSNCKKLTSVEFPSTFKEIKQYGLQGSSITDIVFKSEIPPTFMNAVSKITVTVPSAYKSNYEAKKDTNSLDYSSYWSDIIIITFNSLGELTQAAFRKYCEDNASDLGVSDKTEGERYKYITSFPAAYTSIANATTEEDGVFYGCTSLKTVEIPEGVDVIGAYAFSGCSALEEINIPKSVQKIAAYTFTDCAAIKIVNYGGTIADWCRITFVTSSASPFVSSGSAKLYVKSGSSYVQPSGNVDLTSISGTAVTKIPYGTFRNCNDLISISLPSSLKTIEPYAFYGCTQLASATFNNVSKSWNLKDDDKVIGTFTYTDASSAATALKDSTKTTYTWESK